jgi:hypothetical protein
MIRTTKFRQAALALGVAVMLAGCAGPNPRDPYEGFNRAMFNFNDTVDLRAETGGHGLQERDPELRADRRQQLLRQPGRRLERRQQPAARQRRTACRTWPALR